VPEVRGTLPADAPYSYPRHGGPGTTAHPGGEPVPVSLLALHVLLSTGIEGVSRPERLSPPELRNPPPGGTLPPPLRWQANCG
jgi:hypothetical protein